MRRNLVGEHHLFIVSRDAPDVAQFLIEQFPRGSNVSVVLDRRRGERRSALSPVQSERRARDRRRRADVERELCLHTHAFVTLNCE